MSKSQFEQLKNYIEKRKTRSNNKGRALSISINKMEYSNRVSLGSYNKKFDNALFVGVGHGHDVLMHLINGYIKKADGVDPYFALDGNDDLDYSNLINLTQDLGLSDRLTIYKKTIQTYLDNCKKNYDLIVLPDVLHHIFVTEKLLNHSEWFDECVDLFQGFYKITNNECDLLISDAPRFGLRANLAKKRIIKSHVDYKTKQPSEQWRLAVEKAGWTYQSTEFYIPYAFRQLSIILKIPIFSWFISNRYFIRFKKIN